jgi:hypothetical protein
VFGVREVLPGLAFAIAAAAAALFAWRAPFRPLVLALTLFGAFFLDEYAVLARNYGIAMLLMFAFAALYGRWRERGVGLGVLLALLANTNVPSVLIAGALGLFWGIELLGEEGWRWTPAWRRYAANMALLLGGVLACFVAVYPPSQDAAVSPMAGRLDVGTVLLALGDFPAMFHALLPETWWDWRIMPLLLAALVIGSPLGLIRRPGGSLPRPPVMVAMPLFFMIVYPGGYRHQALYVCLLVTLYWLVANGHGGRWPVNRPGLRPALQTVVVRCGQVAFVTLLAAQALLSISVVGVRAAAVPYSRTRDLAALLERERLGQAVVMADADVVLEPLPYYAANPVWQTRPHRFGHVVAFTKANAYDLHFGRILADAHAVRARTGRPVVIVTQLRLDPPPRRRPGRKAISASCRPRRGRSAPFSRPPTAWPASHRRKRTRATTCTCCADQTLAANIIRPVPNRRNTSSRSASATAKQPWLRPSMPRVRIRSGFAYQAACTTIARASALSLVGSSPISRCDRPCFPT